MKNLLTQKEVLEILRNNLPFLKEKYGVRKIAIFGSFAKEIQKEDSDIDIIIEFEKPIGLKFVELAEYIETILGKEVDILTPEGVKSIRYNEVVEDIKRSVVYV